jgi:phage shock protein PspC (stress-responsive transcriptional regulator)
MKKNFSVNIGGRVFNIDDDAYERLNAYLSSLRKYFAADAGCEEIMTDIEGRIAELLDQKKPSGLTVINIDLINEVIAGMGEPDQLSSDETGTNHNSNHVKAPGKLYRDTDNRMVGGVAAGIAAYFNIDPTWIRLLFVASIFLYMTGAIVYLVLWFILPEAKTTAEKLEMQRRLINVGTLRDEIASAGAGLKKTGNSMLGAIGTFLRFLTEVLTYIVKLFIKVIRMASGVVLLSLVIFMFVGYILAYLLRNDFETGIYHLNTTTLTDMLNWYLPGPSVSWLAYLAITFLTIGLAGLFIYLGLRLLLKWPPLRWQILGAFGLLVIAGMIFGGGAIYQYSRSTLGRASSSEISTHMQKSKMLHITLAPGNPDQYWKPMQNPGDTKSVQLALGKIQIDVRPVPGDSLFVTGVRESLAYQDFVASEYLKNMKYNYNFQDTLLILEPYFTFPKQDGMHHQSLEIIVGVPLNTLVKLDENVAWKMNYRDFIDESAREGEYIMTTSGLRLLNPPNQATDTTTMN